MCGHLYGISIRMQGDDGKVGSPDGLLPPIHHNFHKHSFVLSVIKYPNRIVPRRRKLNCLHDYNNDHHEDDDDAADDDEMQVKSIGNYYRTTISSSRGSLTQPVSQSAVFGRLVFFFFVF